MRKLAIVSAVVASVFALAGCQGEKPGADVAGKEGQVSTTLQSKISMSEEYIVVSAYNNIEYFNAHKWQWKASGKMFGVKTSWVGPMDGNTSAMVSALDSAIAKQPAGIAVWGYDPALKPSIDKAADAGIPIVTMVGDVKGSKRLSYIGSSQFDVGFSGGSKFAESRGGKGKVAILTLPGNPMFEERVAGFKEAFSKYPEIQVVAIGDTKADTVAAVNAAKDIMVKVPDLDAFVCTDSTGAIGSVTAVKEMDKVGKVDIIGMDRNTDILQKVKDGEIKGTIVQDDVGMAYWSMMTLVTAKHMKSALSSDNKAANATVFPDSIYTPINFVGKSNADFYLKANKLYAE